MKSLPGGYVEVGGLVLSPDRQRLVADVLSRGGHGREDRLTVISHGLGADIQHISQYGRDIAVHVPADEVDNLLAIIDPALSAPETEAVDVLSVNPFICQYTAGSVLLEHAGGTSLMSPFSALNLGSAMIDGRAVYLAEGGVYDSSPEGGTWTPRHGEPVEVSAADVAALARWLISRVAPGTSDV